MTDKFAHGRNKVDGCPCPALAAGFKPGEDPVEEVILVYDREMHDNGHGNRGVAIESVVKEAWFEALRTLDHDFPGDYPDAIDQGEAVAEKLGW